MAVSDTPFVPGDGKVEILGLAGVVLFEATYELGDFTGDLTNITDRIVGYDRFKIAFVRKGRQRVLTGGFTIHGREFTNASAAVMRDVATFEGSALGNAGVADIPSDYDMVDIRFTALKTAVSSDTANAVITYNDCVLFGTWGEGEPAAAFAFSYECFGGSSTTGQA